MKYFIYYLFFIIIILFFAYINTQSSAESFTPHIRGLYRPIVRHTRIIGEGFYNKTSSNISNLFRRFGII
jgi:hypothetical protein